MKKEKEEVNGEGEKSEEGILLNASLENTSSEEIEESALIEEAFGESIEYEEIAEIESSPMNEAVKEGEVSDGFSLKEGINLNEGSLAENTEEDLPEGLLEDFEEDQLPPSDAPEQVVDEEEELGEEGVEEPIRTAAPIDQADQHAGIAADSLLGIADNILEIGGGFFVKIKRRKSHLYFDELLERSKKEKFPRIGAKIDSQNEKNFKRIKLDPTDVALLRPILIEVLKNQTKKMTPEQQLAAVAISIAVKKGQAMVEMKAENKLFVQQLDDTMEKYCQRFEENLEKEEEILNRKRDEKEREEKEVKEAA